MYYSLVAMLIFGARLVYFGASIGDALALAALAGLYGYQYYLETKKEKPVDEEYKKKIAYLSQEVESLKSSMNAVKIAKTFTGR